MLNTGKRVAFYMTVVVWVVLLRTICAYDLLHVVWGTLGVVVVFCAPQLRQYLGKTEKATRLGLLTLVVFFTLLRGSGECYSEIDDAVDVWVRNRFDRLFVSDTCPRGAPCHVYLTYPEDARTGIIVNFHAVKQYRDPVVMWKVESGGIGLAETARELVVQFPYWEGRRYVYWTELSGLEPDTTYLFYCGDRYSEEYSEWKKFRSAPSTNGCDTKASMVVGLQMCS